MSDYKPLTNEELDWVNHWQARKIFRERIMEQLRRANALAAAIKKMNTFLETAGNYRGIAKLEDDADEALARYLGETND